jgi:dienelactone hydrolase
VNADVARSWRRYDIRAILEENWTQLGPKLKGKLNVFMGDLDTFYLDGATRRLKASQEKLGSDATIEIVADRDHGSIADGKLRQRIDRELIQIFNAAHPEFQQPGLVYD